jgi:hypothetical protein
MPLIDYDQSGWTPNVKYADIIDQANAICAQYLQQGYDLTLRQLYYQFVARGLLANKQENYDLLGRVCVKARENGYMDWDYLTDRTRNLASLPHWETPADILKSAVASFRLDKWAEADHVVEVWVEKEALSGIVQTAAEAVDIPHFACRGYVSSSEIYVAVQRLRAYIEDGKEVTVLHLGDHDPSGLNMTDDNGGRLRQFLAYHVGDDVSMFHFKRIALNPPQIAQYAPPPNPAKQTDSRYAEYVAATGQTDSWELDALDPAVLVALITQEVEALRDDDVWAEATQEEKEHKRLLKAVSDRWADVSAYIDTEEGTP